jgi:hypothetical protein
MQKEYFYYLENKTYIESSQISKKEINAFFALVSKKINEYIIRSNFVIDKLYDFRGSISNYTLYKELPAKAFIIEFDIDNCYWQALHKIGVINEDIYKRYYLLHNVYKTYKAIAITLTTSEGVCNYYKNGKPFLDSFGNHYSIKEDKRQWIELYDNIRYWGENVIQNCIDKFKLKVIYSTVDSLMIPIDFKNDKDLKLYNKICNYFNENKIDFKINHCSKLSDRYISKGDKIYDLEDCRYVNSINDLIL